MRFPVTLVAIALPIVFAVAPTFGAGIAPHSTTPAGTILQGCSEVGCPITPQYKIDQLVNDTHASIPKGQPGNDYSPCYDGTGYDPGMC